LIGNLTQDPELRYTPSGVAVTDIVIAVNEKRRASTGEWVEETTFINVIIWGRTAEYVHQNTQKSSRVFVEGKLKIDTWNKDGEKRTKLKVVSERIVLLDKESDRNDEEENT